MAIRFNAPAYARTSEAEVRDLRISLAPHLSQVVGTYRQFESNSNSSTNQTFNPSMSPSEAVVILLMMLQQKETNSFYQMTAAEKAAIWSQLHSKDGIQLSDNDGRIQEIKQIANTVGNLSETEKLSLANRALDILGMEL